MRKRSINSHRSRKPFALFSPCSQFPFCILFLAGLSLIVSHNAFPVFIHPFYPLGSEVLQQTHLRTLHNTRGSIPLQPHYSAFCHRGKHQSSPCSKPMTALTHDIMAGKFPLGPSAGAHRTSIETTVGELSVPSACPPHALRHRFSALFSLQTWLLQPKGGPPFFHLLSQISKTMLSLIPFLPTQVKIFTFYPAACPYICVIM